MGEVLIYAGQTHAVHPGQTFNSLQGNCVSALSINSKKVMSGSLDAFKLNVDGLRSDAAVSWVPGDFHVALLSPPR